MSGQIDPNCLQLSLAIAITPIMFHRSLGLSEETNIYINNTSVSKCGKNNRVGVFTK